MLDWLQWWFVNPGSDSPEISLIRTKGSGTYFLFWTVGRFSNPEISAGNKRARINESSLYIRCFIVVRAMITATPFILVRKEVAYQDVLTGPLGSRHQPVTGTWKNFGIWNRRSLPETNASEWLAWRKLVATLILLFFILIFIKQLLTEYSIVLCKQSWLATARERVDKKKKLTPLVERFIQITSRRVTFLTANPLCITYRNCFLYASVHRNCQEPPPMNVENVGNIDILPFWKTFYDRHCAPYKWNFAVFGIG